MTQSKLTTKQDKFAKSIGYQEYDYIWEAYSAHYSTANMSKNSIYQESCKLLANPKVSQRVKEYEEEFAKKHQTTLEEVLIQMTNWIKFNPKSIHNPDGSLKGLDEMTDEEAECIQDFQTEEIWGGKGDARMQIGELKKVKIVDKVKLADMWLKKFGAYITKFKVENDDLEHIKDIVNGISE